jgi:hypothetical protein
MTNPEVKSGFFARLIESNRQKRLVESERRLFDNSAMVWNIAVKAVGRSFSEEELGHIPVDNPEEALRITYHLAARHLITPDVAEKVEMNIDTLVYILGQGMYEAKKHVQYSAGKRADDGSLANVIKELAAAGVAISHEECLTAFDYLQTEAILRGADIILATQ